MKLELKHLAPYLPYDLQISTDDVDEDWIETIIGLNNEAIETSVGNYWNYTVKPILRPLSDIENEFEYKGENIIASKKLSINKYSILLLKAWGNDSGRLIFSDAQKLLEWHFDVFGLIDAGLAIDINTLKKKL